MQMLIHSLHFPLGFANFPTRGVAKTSAATVLVVIVLELKMYVASKYGCSNNPSLLHWFRQLPFSIMLIQNIVFHGYGINQYYANISYLTRLCSCHQICSAIFHQISNCIVYNYDTSYQRGFQKCVYAKKVSFRETFETKLTLSPTYIQ